MKENQRNELRNGKEMKETQRCLGLGRENGKEISREKTAEKFPERMREMERGKWQRKMGLGLGKETGALYKGISTVRFGKRNPTAQIHPTINISSWKGWFKWEK